MGNKKKVKNILLALKAYYVDTINDWLDSIVQFLKDLGEVDYGE